MSRFLLLCLVCSSVGSLVALADEVKKPTPAKREPGLQLRYTFAAMKKDQVSDASGNTLTGTLVKGKVVREGDHHVLELAGTGHVQLAASARLDPSGGAVVLGAWVMPSVSRGVIVAIGDETNGLSLYLKNGVPTFAVRSRGKLTLARAENRATAGRWVHLLGVLEADGRIRVWVDGRASGDAAQAETLKVRPADGLSIGADTGSPVGDYPDEQPFTGKIRDVRFYRGVPAEKVLQKWASQK